jgi:hypothetical protein
MRRLDLARGLPVHRVDPQTTEWVGNFPNPGRTWRQQPRDVLDHDVPSGASGQGLPYGIDGAAHNDG